jgi:hypothetical protein
MGDTPWRHVGHSLVVGDNLHPLALGSSFLGPWVFSNASQSQTNVPKH